MIAQVHYTPLPANWYIVGESRAFGRNPRKLIWSGHELVLYRDTSSRLCALNARCAHMGADLSRGQINGDCLRCPFHGWNYDGDGRCASIPAQARQAPPDWARVQSYAVFERHGLVFVHLGGRAEGPPPFFWGENPDDFIASSPFQIDIECPWELATANAFDLQHFSVVHQRHFVSPSQLTSPHINARRVRHHYRIDGTATLEDRLAAWAAGPSREAHLDFTSWRGTYALAVTKLGRSSNHMLFSLEPTGKFTCRATMVVLRKKASAQAAALAARVSLGFRKHLTRRFFEAEIRSLRGLRYRRQTLIEADAFLRDYMDWLLPESPRGLSIADRNDGEGRPFT